MATGAVEHRGKKPKEMKLSCDGGEEGGVGDRGVRAPFLAPVEVVKGKRVDALKVLEGTSTEVKDLIFGAEAENAGEDGWMGFTWWGFEKAGAWR